MPWDQALWDRAGVALGALSEVRAEAAALLAQTANYPWNKICRTAFLRDHGIGCSPILLHEDVELHWRSFHHANTILASDRICVVHGVDHDGDRLTNLESPARLEVFPVLEKLAAEMAGGPFALPFARFALGLAAWIGGNVAADEQDRLRALTQAFRDGLPAPVRAKL